MTGRFLFFLLLLTATVAAQQHVSDTTYLKFVRKANVTREQRYHTAVDSAGNPLGKEIRSSETVFRFSKDGVHILQTSNPQVAEYAYDNRMNLLLKKESGGALDLTYKYEYDPGGRCLVRLSSVFGDSLRMDTAFYRYDSSGKLVAILFCKGNKVSTIDSCFYDAKGRLVLERFSCPDGSTPYRTSIVHVYDEQGRQTGLTEYLSKPGHVNIATRAYYPDGTVKRETIISDLDTVTRSFLGKTVIDYSPEGLRMRLIAEREEGFDFSRTYEYDNRHLLTKETVIGSYQNSVYRYEYR